MIKGLQNYIFRVYADTSVFGGVFDEEFDEASNSFFEAVKRGRFKLFTSQLVNEEVQAAPVKVVKFFEECLTFSDIAEVTTESLALKNAYMNEGIVSSNYSTDALHVALATVSKCDLIVSWNFKHIVNFQKIPLYNAVNTLNGFGKIDIYSPLEVIEYEN